MLCLKDAKAFYGTATHKPSSWNRCIRIGTSMGLPVMCWTILLENQNGSALNADQLIGGVGISSGYPLGGERSVLQNLLIVSIFNRTWTCYLKIIIGKIGDMYVSCFLTCRVCNKREHSVTLYIDTLSYWSVVCKYVSIMRMLKSGRRWRSKRKSLRTLAVHLQVRWTYRPKNSGFLSVQLPHLSNQL